MSICVHISLRDCLILMHGTQCYFSLFRQFFKQIKGSNHMSWHSLTRTEFMCVQKFLSKDGLDNSSENNPPPNTDVWKIGIQPECIFFTDKQQPSCYAVFILNTDVQTRHVQRDWWADKLLLWKCNTCVSTMINHNHKSLSILSFLDCPQLKRHPVVNRPMD